MVKKEDRDAFRDNPSAFLEQAIKKYVAECPDNRLAGYDDKPLFDEPLVGFANGNDPIFGEYKKDIIIGDFHLTPGEALPIYLTRQGKKKQVNHLKPDNITVISAAFPLARSIRKSNRNETFVGSKKWNEAHHKGFAFIEGCLQSVAELLDGFGYVSVVPSYTKPLVEIVSIHGITSDWSEKHIAYAAGLGTFSLNGGFITRKGKAVCLCSLITGLSLPVTSRTYRSHTAYCLFYQDGSCKRCITRCPSGAITERGYDASTCFNYSAKSLCKIIKESGKEGYPEEHIICGLCETMIPCEDRIPPKIKL